MHRIHGKAFTLRRRDKTSEVLNLAELELRQSPGRKDRVYLA